MQLQEMKKLVEYEAIGTLMATVYGDGWTLIALKKDESNKVAARDCALELARGGVRKFKTLDAISKLVKNDLHGLPFSVC